LESAELRADEIGNPMYVIVFEDLTVEVDATTGEIINPPVDMPSLPETEEVPQEEIPEETPEETPVNENEPFFPENLGDF